MRVRDECVKGMKSTIDQLNPNMKVIEDRAESTKKDPRKQCEEQLVKMRVQSKSAIAKLLARTRSKASRHRTCR